MSDEGLAMMQQHVLNPMLAAQPHLLLILVIRHDLYCSTHKLRVPKRSFNNNCLVVKGCMCVGRLMSGRFGARELVKVNEPRNVHFVQLKMEITE